MGPCQDHSEKKHKCENEREFGNAKHIIRMMTCSTGAKAVLRRLSPMLKSPILKALNVQREHFLFALPSAGERKAKKDCIPLPE
jgi:hypothetical protein